MSRFFTSDPHFWHLNVIAYCKRPYADVAEMNAALIKNWNDKVKPDDEIYILGDFAFGGVAKIKDIAGQLNGKKILVKGNHDDDRVLRRGEEFGFANVYTQMELTVGGKRLTLCHYPYSGDHTPMERYKDRRPLDDGGWLLHGHIHTLWKVKNRQINVGVDVWDYAPVSEQQILEIING